MHDDPYFVRMSNYNSSLFVPSAALADSFREHEMVRKTARGDMVQNIRDITIS